jgi:hypothetical protein
MRLPFVSLLFTLLAVSSVLLCAVLDEPLLAAAPLVLLLLYVLVAFWLSAGDPSDLEWFADHVYFLGYVSTITAFAGVVLRAWLFDEGFDDVRPVLLMGGIALLTTVAGLVGMTFIRSYARMLEDRYGTALAAGEARPRVARSAAPRGLARVAAESALADPGGTATGTAPGAGGAPRHPDAGPVPAALGPVAVPSAFEPVPDELRDASAEAARAIQALDEQLRELNLGIARLHEIVTRSNPEVERLVRNVTEVQSVLDGFVAYLGTRLEEDTLGVRAAGASSEGRPR